MSSSKTIAELRAAWLQKLSESCLTEQHAKELQLKLYTADQMKVQFKTLPLHLGGFRIPYFDLQGRPTKFYRFRYLEEPERNGFGAVTKHKPFRYGQPAGTINEVYLPPFAPWNEIASNVSIPIIITEGELKAACACSYSQACMGLGGVWSFGAKEKGIELLPIFDDIQWQNRIVFVIFDSDAVTNPQVVLAENTFCRRLANLGALPRVVRLTEVPKLKAENKKTGLDDFILFHNGIDELKKLMEETTPFLEYQELHKLNEEVAYVRNPGMILEFATKQRMSVEAFQRHSYATRFMIRVNKVKEKDVTQKLSAPKEWIQWHGRNSVSALTYVPGNTELTVGGKFNTWTGWGCKPEPGDIRPWRDLIDTFFAEDMEFREWFEQWFAYPLQYPGTKLMSAIVLWSRTQGNGKSTIGETMHKIYGDNYVHIDNTQLESSFNEWSDSKQFVMGDEITGNDRRAYADKLKNLVTQTQVYVNKKHLPTYSIPDCINYYFTSNHPDVIQLDETDRRFFVHQVPDPPLGDEFWRYYYDWLENKNGAAHLFHYFLHLKMGEFNPNSAPPITRSKRNMELLACSDLGLWCRSLRDQPDTVTTVGMVVDDKWMYTAEELRAFYDPEGKTRVTANGMSRELTRAGLKQVNKGLPIQIIRKDKHTVSAKSVTKRLWIVREHARIARLTLQDIAAVYLEQHDMQKKKFERK